MIMNDPIEYRHNVSLDPAAVARVFDAAGLRRPTNDLARIARMFAAANLVLSAWHGEQLVGVSRALTDHCLLLLPFGPGR